MQVFFSDPHFSHFNILEYDNRPFSSVEEMDETIITNVLDSIAAKDEVYFLGDLAFHKKPDDVRRLLERLTVKGRWYFIRGNHDRKKNVNIMKTFACDGAVHDILTISPAGQPIVLCHYPMIQWNKGAHGAWHLHGHDHKNFTYGDGKKRYNVALNLNNYRPISLAELFYYFTGLQY